MKLKINLFYLININFIRRLCLKIIKEKIMATMRSTSMKRFTPAFLALIDETSRKCFGNLPVQTYRTGFKVLSRKPIGPILADHYLPDSTRMFRDMTTDFKTKLEKNREDLLVRLKKRLKGPPKKGQGKRAQKKK
jgi:hypothetical protein